MTEHEEKFTKLQMYFSAKKWKEALEIACELRLDPGTLDTLKKEKVFWMKWQCEHKLSEGNNG